VHISTRRLLLRDFTADDAPAVHAFDADPVLTRYRGGARVTEADTRAFIGRTQQWLSHDPRPIYALAMLLPARDELIGVVGLTITDQELRAAELWYRLARPHWGRGYATEAARAMLSFGFAALGLHRIAALCHPDNVGSWRVMEKLGMRREGRLRENVPSGDSTWRDSLLYAVIEHDWRELQRDTPT